ncbi:MAG: L-threonylcarbamoyladenylate synthase [Bacteroidia bacterium]|nr:L-threonylcarbamoyladenylate synthase [Bacteroidia bacterium]
MQFHTQIGTSLDEAAHWLKQGETVGIPTETVYGLAANALDADAAVKIFQIKNRPGFNPLIVHVHSAAEFEKYAQHVPVQIKKLAEVFSPGPLTFVLPRRTNIPDIITAGGDTVGLRVPAHPLTQALLQKLPFPLAAPSANPFGYISPVTAQHVADQLYGKVPYILDGGPSEVGVESTVVTVRNDKVVVLRLGGITLEQLREVAGEVELDINESSNPQSPGQLKSHYAPRIPLKWGIPATQPPLEKVAVLCLQQPPAWSNIVSVETLSATGNLAEAARNLFAAMRRLDETDAQCIFAERMPETGLGKAINDRLKRASVENF